MKINRGDVSRTYNTAINDGSAAADINKKNGSKPLTSVDKVTISEKAKEYSPVKNVAGAIVKSVTSSTPSEKLLKLRDAVSSGEYDISGEDLADIIVGKQHKK